MPASYEEDALIAQGMAAYTNAHYLAALRRADPPEELKGADFSADPSKRLGYVTEDTMKTMWGDHYEEYHQKVTKAAEKAMQYLITYEGQPIVAAYLPNSPRHTTEHPVKVRSSTGTRKLPGITAPSPFPLPNCGKS